MWSDRVHKLILYGGTGMIVLVLLWLLWNEHATTSAANAQQASADSEATAASNVINQQVQDGYFAAALGSINGTSSDVTDANPPAIAHNYLTNIPAYTAPVVDMTIANGIQAAYGAAIPATGT